jgi:hypothetical protein
LRYLGGADATTKSIVSLSHFFRVSSVALTYYAIFIVRGGATEGNLFSSMLGGAVPFLLLGSVIYFAVSIFVTSSYDGKIRVTILLMVCALTALDFANDFAAVFFKVQLLPV